MTTVAGGLGIYADDANVSNARVSVTTLVNEHGHGIATVDRAEFLRAVETELNVKIINRADLPTVTEGPDGSLNARGATLTSDGEAYGSDALGWHAIAEHLEAHPPVSAIANLKQVDALLEQVAADRTSSGYWRGRGEDLDAVEAYLTSLRDHLTTRKAD